MSHVTLFLATFLLAETALGSISIAVSSTARLLGFLRCPDAASWYGGVERAWFGPQIKGLTSYCLQKLCNHG